MKNISFDKNESYKSPQIMTCGAFFFRSAFERSSAPLLGTRIFLRFWRGESVKAEIVNFTYLHIEFNDELSKYLFINLFRVIRFH